MKSVKVPALELFLHEMIPLAKAMGVGVEVSDAKALVLIAPKEQNKNSINTAFGGSLVSLATLADHFALLSLVQARALPVCRSIETIANLMRNDCATGLQPASITNNDLALLTGLYRTPDADMGRLQRQRIIGNMRQTLEAQAKH